MSIIRVSKDKNNPYFIMNNSGVNDPNLSLKAKGLLAYLISKPDNWFINYNDIIKHSTNRIKSIRSAISELLSHGYMVRSQFRNYNGEFGYHDFIVFEKPQSINIRKNNLSPYSRFGHAVKGHAVKGTLLSTNKREVLKTTTTPGKNNSNSSTSPVVDPATPNKQKEIIALLEKLNIRNFKKIFKEFPLDKIFDYATWIINRNSKMSNPTGFIISAMRENWIDYDKTPEVKKIPRWWIYCFPCRKNYTYQSIAKIQYTCPICKKLIPFSEHERF